MVKIGLLGMGTVGSGVYEILTNKKSMVEEYTGKKVEIARILVNDLKKDRNIKIDENILTNNPMDILEDPEIHIIVEVLGGMELPYEYMVKALKNGKHVVTANKEVLSKHLYDLNNIAKENKKSILYEASVAGGIPVIKALYQMIGINNIIGIKGILNGTTNFILSKMSEEGIGFEEALKTAQKLGYAEADPTDDIEGYDAARKMAILSSISFDYNVKFDDVQCTGISSISSFDINFFKKLGLVVKLIGNASISEGGLNASVEPVLIDEKSIMANVGDAYNILSITGDTVGELQFYGQGAGKDPTANAVVSDLMDIINKEYKYINFKNGEKRLEKFKLLGKYYLRISLENTEDRHNILKQINKYGIKYNLLEKNKNLILILQETTGEQIKEIIGELKLKDKSSYAKIESSNIELMSNLNTKDLNKFAI